MPLIMEEEMNNVDHLFNDDSILMLPSRPPSKDLYQRLDELRGSGCCQGIAWSKWGSIASITSNGTALELRNLRCHPDDGTWALSEPSVESKFTGDLQGGPLKHLSWSPTGSDLAVIDTAGRVAILTIFASLNKPNINRFFKDDDPVDDLHGIVGSYWLNLAPYPQSSRSPILQGPGVKDGKRYRYESSQSPTLGPSHPHPTKSAFVCLTTNGVLRLIWPQTNNARWSTAQTELESIVSSDDLITHAAICPDKNNTLLIAYATTNKQLRTVRALIEWNQPKSDKIPPAQLPVQPTIKTRHLAVTSWAHDLASDPINASNMESSMAQLSHLEFLAPCVGATKSVHLPTIVTIRSHLPVSSSHYNQDVHTTIDRWEVREKSQTVHPAFEQLSSRRNSVTSPPGNVVFLKRMESVTINKITISFDIMNHGRVVILAHSDGSLEYRDRATWEETFNDGNLNEVWHLSQIGFTYPEDEPCLQVAMSPSYCSLVAINNEGKVTWKQLSYHLGELGTSMDDDPMYAAFVTALSVSGSTAIMKAVNYDDLLATANKYATPQFAYDWVTEISGILKVNMDYSDEQHHDGLVRNTSIQLCLCMQSSLGFKGKFNPRTFSGKFSWLVLQLRNIVVLIAMAATLKVPNSDASSSEKTSPLEEPEVINSLVGSVSWTLDLIAWLVDTLLDLSKTIPSTIDLTSPDLPLSDLLAHLHTTNTISLHFVLSSASRGFLIAICRRLQHLEYIARRTVSLGHGASGLNGSQPNVPSSLSPALKAAYMQIALRASAAVIKIKTIETFLAAISGLIKNAYAVHPQTANPTTGKDHRRALEVKMGFGSSFPDAFKSVIVEIYRADGLLDQVREEIEPSKLFFANFERLEVDDEKRAREKRMRMGKTMDCFRKEWLVNPKPSNSTSASLASGSSTNAGPGTVEGGYDNGSESTAVTTVGKPGARWRVCARCASVMDDSVAPRTALQWLNMQQRRCFCSGYWNSLAPGEMVA